MARSVSHDTTVTRASIHSLIVIHRFLQCPWERREGYCALDCSSLWLVSGGEGGGVEVVIKIHKIQQTMRLPTNKQVKHLLFSRNSDSLNLIHVRYVVNLLRST